MNWRFIPATVLTTLVILFAALWAGKKRQGSVQDLARKQKQQQLVEARQQKQIRAKALSSQVLHSQRREILTKTIESAKIKVDPTCLGAWNQLQASNLDPDDPKNIKILLPDLSACTSSEVAELKPLHDEYEKQCQLYIGQKSPEQISSNDHRHDSSSRTREDCLFAAFNYRASVNDNMTKNQKIEEIFDLRLLADKLLSSFFQLHNFSRMERVAQRILELEPDFYPAQKAIVVAAMMQAMNEKDPSQSDERWAHFDEAQKHAEDFGFADSELLESALFAHTRGFQWKDKVESEARHLQAQYPKLGMGDYYLAGLEWNRGNQEAAQNYLKAALAKEPNNVRFQETAKQMQEMIAHGENGANSSKKIFTFALGFRLHFNQDTQLLENSAAISSEPEDSATKKR